MKKNNVPTEKSSGFLAWLDEHILLLLTGFLLAFIPLYPKLPLVDLITGYIVRLRLEDLAIAVTALVWFIQVYRKKISIRTPLTFIISAYLAVGLLSSLSAIYITHTVPFVGGISATLKDIFTQHTLPLRVYHVAKLFLHYFRRVEYLSLFFVAYAAVKRKSDAVKLIWIFVFSALAVAVYGLGQKYLYWPVYSTMNREFSKGVRLYLTEHARVQSTFGGHYDFAAYLVMALPLSLACFFVAKKFWLKLVSAATFVLGLWGLMMTSSRSSFLAYVLAATIVLVLYAFRKGWKWFVVHAAMIYLLTAVFFFLFGDLSKRFGQIFSSGTSFGVFQTLIEGVQQRAQQPLIAPPADGISIDDVAKAIAEAEKKEPPAPKPASTPLPTPTPTPVPTATPETKKSIALITPEPSPTPTPASTPESTPTTIVVTKESTSEAKTAKPVIDESDTQPSPAEPLPGDVFVDIPAQVIATKSPEGKDIVIVMPRIFSENAHLLGLSAAIRLDTLWPFAIRGFLRNPLLGSGYSTLTKYTNDQFTEAESTDNDFLRTLGETGLLGFLTFYGTMIVAIRYAWKAAKRSDDPWLHLLAVTLTAATMGLFVNAMYIDVFVSSKVIQVYWMLTGMVLAYAALEQKEKESAMAE